MMTNFRPLFGLSIISAFLLALTPLAAHAVLFSSDISISGSITYDGFNSSATGTTQGGSISSIIGGSTITSTITGATISGTNPLVGNLTDFGDGFGSSFNMSGDQNGDEGALFSDYAFAITNNSATDQFQVSFSLNFVNTANADGVDAFADSQIALTNETTAAEFFFSDLTSDALFGDKENGISLASFGASLSDGGVIIFDFLLNPLASIDLSGINELEGGVFDNVSSFGGQLTSFISVTNVENLTNPEPPPTRAPEPSTLFLLGFGLFAAGVVRRKARR